MALSKTEEKIYELLKSNDLYRGEKGVYTVFPQKLPNSRKFLMKSHTRLMRLTHK